MVDMVPINLSRDYSLLFVDDTELIIEVMMEFISSLNENYFGNKLVAKSDSCASE